VSLYAGWAASLTTMDAIESLRSVGFDVEIEQEAPDLYWCHLVPVGGSDDRVPEYGRGSTEQEAIERAWKRYQQEQ
jgi:hypothetical protein